MNEHLIDALIAKSRELPPGPAQVAVLEEAVRLADAQGLEGTGYGVRQQLITAAVMGGRVEVAITAFSRCLAASDRDPERFPINQLMWKYKWILGHLTDFPNISREQIDRMLGDFATRTRSLGWGERTIEYMRWSVAFEMGDLDLAARCYDKWRLLPRDVNSNCHACETNATVRYLIIRRSDHEALKAAQPILNGNLSCSKVPHTTHGTILTPLLRLGHLEEADTQFRLGYPLVSQNPTFIETVSWYLIYLTRARRTADAVKLFRKHVSWSLNSHVGYDRFHFSHAAAVFLECLAQTRETVPVQLPESFPDHQQRGTYRAADLATRFRTWADDLAVEFDRRNQNDYMSQLAAEIRTLAGVE